jgi:hypothetical protein
MLQTLWLRFICTRMCVHLSTVGILKLLLLNPYICPASTVKIGCSCSKQSVAFGRITTVGFPGGVEWTETFFLRGFAKMTPWNLYRKLDVTKERIRNAKTGFESNEIQT